MASNTYRVSQDFLCFEGVDEPHGNIADQKEGDGLAGGLAAFLFGQVDATAGHIGDEQQLKNHLVYERKQIELVTTSKD